MFDFWPAVGEIATLRGLVSSLGGLEVAEDDAGRIDQIRALEEVKAAAAAAQARVVTAFAASQSAAQAAVGVPAERLGRGVAAQVGLAKRESPTRAARYLHWASVLVADLPMTFTALAQGQISEWRAQLVAREVGWLTPEQRTCVDVEVGPHLAGWGDRQVEAQARRAAYRLDPSGALARTRGAETDRHVTLRPAPDTMSLLSALLPVAQGVAVLAALRTAADTGRAAGDGRSRGQLMADTLVERVTGQASAAAVPVQVSLLVPADSLLADGGEPAHLQGYGPVPAPAARELVRTATDSAQAWIRRLFLSSEGTLVAMESRRRLFPPALAEYLRARDQVCRTPWCGAPIRHIDHVVPHSGGGPTSAANGQGVCEACNAAKQAPGWRARPSPLGAGDQVEIVTPTGHRHTSRPPRPPGTAPTGARHDVAC